MAVLDLQVFLQERALEFDENLDISSGSPFDTKVIQPTLRRLGTDPFTVDIATFLHDRMKQAFPEIASDEGDAVTDLLIKPATLLWDPFVREVFRIHNGLSFADPATLTREEAAALGANLFSDIESGELSRGTARAYFDQPRTVSFTPNNFFTSKTGLHFFPDGIQSITMEEMLLNYDGSNYYFDIELVAESAGSQYDIGPAELVTVANIDSATRVTNLRRFRGGQDEETAVEFTDRSAQELTERSMVTLRGIGAKLTRSFPEISRLNVVGYGDPEMQRDVITGGGLGAIQEGGVQARVKLDGTGAVGTRRVSLNDAGVDLTATLGPIGEDVSGWVLTIHGAFASPPVVRDLEVARVISSDTLEVTEQVLSPTKMSVDLGWTLRRRELTIAGIPGGVLFPDAGDTVVTIPNDEVHVGGMNDIHVRGIELDESTLVIDNVTDDNPGAQGVALQHTAIGQVTLADYVLGVNYAEGGAIHTLFAEAKANGFTLQILSGPHAGNYRVINVWQTPFQSPILVVNAGIAATPGDYRWRLVDVIEVDLTEPKETRTSGSDLLTTQNTDVVSSTGGTDFNALGVSVGDTLRIENGPNAGDYEVKALPGFSQLQVDQDMVATGTGASFTIFRANQEEGVTLPLIRITGIELLDTTGQPVGSRVPYAKPVDVQSRAFQNPGRGVKVSVSDGRLGIVSQTGNFALAGKTLSIYFPETAQMVNTSFGGTMNAAGVVTNINAAASAVFGAGTVLAVELGTNQFGIVPVAGYCFCSGAAGIMTEMFGDEQIRTSADIRSDYVDTTIGGWDEVSPAINQDNLDVAQVLSGEQIGFYGELKIEDPTHTTYDGLFSGEGINSGGAAFGPELDVDLEVGARSIGSVRCYFLEPTSIEFNQESYFGVTLGSGATVRFFPDPTFRAVRIPAPPGTVYPKDGSSTGGLPTFNSASQDFVLSGILEGDLLVVRYVPIVGTVGLTDPVLNLALKQLVLSVDDGADQTITFTNDIISQPGAVTRDGAADQINTAVGRDICSIDSSDRLVFEADVALIVRGNSGASYANTLLGFSTAADQNNNSKHQGTYEVYEVGQTFLNVNPPFPAGSGTISSQSYEVVRPGSQRISSTEMNENEAEASLYYFDVELVSEGTGDLWNIDADLQLMVENYRSDGYYLTTEDENLTFSMAEVPSLHISRSILEIGTSDDLANATQISGQNIQITYERSPLVVDAQNFATSETERVVCNNPLARHLIPHFVRFDLDYQGGKREEDLLRELESYITALFPADLLESSDVQDVAYQQGAVSVQNPIDLIAIVHGTDRVVWAERSQNALNTGRLAAFIPDVIELNRRAG